MIKQLMILKAKIDLICYWVYIQWLELLFNNEINSNINYYGSNTIIEEDTDKKLYNGITQLKQTIKIKAKKEKSSLEKILQQMDNIINMATVETEEQKKVREIKKSIYVYKDSDIKTEEDKQKMIDKRIQIYYDLQNKKLQRQLQINIRKAKAENNLELYKQLLQEWNSIYGKRSKN